MAKKRKYKKKRTIINTIITILIIIFLASSYNIIIHILDTKKINNQLSLIEENVNIKKVNDSDNIEIIDSKEDMSNNNPYWDYIKMDLIDVDIKELKKINKHTKGWIKVNGTNINYPFVQAYTNEHYLYHSFDGSRNLAGWIFLDYRNNLANLNDKNTILYGHGRMDSTMFGSLKDILTNGWLDNKENYIITMSTEYENTLWQVFSVYHIPITSDYLQISFKNDQEFIKFGKMLLERSAYDFNTSISQDDRILTLSSCYNKNERAVLHAKLIKKEIK